MRWECSKPDLRSTLIYMPKPTGTHRHRGTRPQAYAGARTHTHTHTHRHTHSLTPGHRPTLVLPPPSATPLRKKTAPSLEGEGVGEGDRGVRGEMGILHRSDL